MAHRALASDSNTSNINKLRFIKRTETHKIPVITRDAEARIACEVAELIGGGVAAGARKRADASVGWLG